MENNTQRLNPWFSIWIKPCATIQQIVDTNSQHFVIRLAVLSGFFGLLNQAMIKNLGDQLEWPYILLGAVILGPFFGIALLYIFSALIRWTGSWIGGNASSRDIRAVAAWSSVPSITPGMLFLVPGLVLFGQELFTAQMPTLATNPSLARLLLGVGVISIVTKIWTFVVFVKCLGQVQGFTPSRALGNLVLAILVAWGLMWVIAFGIVGIMKVFIFLSYQ